MKLSPLVFLTIALLIGASAAQDGGDKGEKPDTMTDDGILLKLFTPQRISDGVKQLFNAIELKVRLASLLRKMLTPENLRQNLSLLRRITNFTMRLSKFLLRYLPTPEPETGYLEQVFPQSHQNNDESPPEIVTQKPLDDATPTDISDPNIDQETLQKLIFGEPPGQ